MATLDYRTTCELNRPVTIKHLDGMFFSQDVKANRIVVNVVRGGVNESLSGSVSANIIRADGSTVVQTGSISGNVASVVMPSAAYAVPGAIAVFVKHTASGVTSTIAAVTGYVYKSTTDTIVDPGTVVPNINELLAKIADCDAATAACIAATAAAPVVDDTAGAGDTNKVWSASKTAGEVSGLKNGVDTVDRLVTDYKTVETPTSTTKGSWDITSGTATLTPSSSGSYFALPAIEVAPLTEYVVSINANSAHPAIIVANYDNNVYSALSSVEVASSGRIERTIIMPQNATHILLTKYGTGTVTVSRKVAKTDKTLTAENIPADAKETGEKIAELAGQTETAIAGVTGTANKAFERSTESVMHLPADLTPVALQNKSHTYWKITDDVATREDSGALNYAYDAVPVSADEMYDCDMYAGTSSSSHPIIITDNDYNVLLAVDNPASISRISFRIIIPSGGTKMLVTQYTNTGTVNICKCTITKAVSKGYVDQQIENTGAVGLFPEAGLTWDWWYTCSVTDVYGTTYIGFIDENAKCGVMMRRADGTVYYKYLDVANNDDDHNPMGVCIDENGYIYAFGTLGHSYANIIAIYKSTEPYTVKCNFTDLTVTLCQPTGATYKCTYSQAFVYNDGTTEYITDFFRIVSTDVGVCYGALQSTDGGTTWVFHGVTTYSDPYIKFVDKGNGRLAMCCTSNPISGNRKIYLGEIDVTTGTIYSDGNSVGTWSTIANGTGTGATQEVASSCDVNAREDFSVLITASYRFRLLDAAYINNTIQVLWALSDQGFMDWTYYLFNGTEDISLGKSGVPFYLYSGYLPGACFVGNKCIAVCRNVSGVQDGEHELYVYDIAGGNPTKKGIFKHLALRPIPCGNDIVAISEGIYNDTSTTEETGIFTAWKLAPAFRHIV